MSKTTLCPGSDKRERTHKYDRDARERTYKHERKKPTGMWILEHMPVPGQRSRGERAALGGCRGASCLKDEIAFRVGSKADSLKYEIAFRVRSKADCLKYEIAFKGGGGSKADSSCL